MAIQGRKRPDLQRRNTGRRDLKVGSARIIGTHVSSFELARPARATCHTAHPRDFPNGQIWKVV